MDHPLIDVERCTRKEKKEIRWIEEAVFTDSALWIWRNGPARDSVGILWLM